MAARSEFTVESDLAAADLPIWYQDFLHAPKKSLLDVNNLTVSFNVGIS